MDRCNTAAHIMEFNKVKKDSDIPERLITGHDVMNVFSLKPGPAIGAVLDTIYEAQAMGEIDSREEALNLVKDQIKAGGSCA